MSALRLMLFDRTCRDGLGLSRIWSAGGWLYGQLGRLDGARGVASWAEGLDWLATCGGDRQLAEIQFWGHGKWGQALIHGEPLDRRCLDQGHPLLPALEVIRERLQPGALWWFRCCETFGATEGRAFARAWADFFSCRAAGHTYLIGFHQSGLHTLAPGEEPRWSASEGLRRGTPDAPEEALPSSPWAPCTITCLHGRVPEGI